MSVVVGTVAAAAGTVPSDAQLVALTRGGDDAAFEELYRRYAGRAPPPADAPSQAVATVDTLVAPAAPPPSQAPPAPGNVGQALPG